MQPILLKNQLVLNHYFTNTALGISDCEENGNQNSVSSFMSKCYPTLFTYLFAKYGKPKKCLDGLARYEIETEIKGLYVCIEFLSFGDIEIVLYGKTKPFNLSVKDFHSQYDAFIDSYKLWVFEKYNYTCYDFLNSKEKIKMWTDYLNECANDSKPDYSGLEQLFYAKYGGFSDTNINYMNEYKELNSFIENESENMQEFIDAGKKVVDSLFSSVNVGGVKFNCLGIY